MVLMMKFLGGINYIKDNHLNSIASADTNPSAVTSFDGDLGTLCINKTYEAEKIEPEPRF